MRTGRRIITVATLWMTVMPSVLFAAAIAADEHLSPPAHLIVSEGFVNPIGFYDAQPTFSWQLPRGTRAQSAYRVVVSDLWDSGKVMSDQSVYVPYNGTPLASRQQLTWKVKFWDQDGRESAWSQPAHVELGLLGNADWDARWIRLQPNNTPAPAAEEKNVKIVIHKALYGVDGKPDQQVDLKAKFQQQANEGMFRVTADNATAGKDPANGIVKTLVLDFTLNGKSVQERLEEGATYNLATGRLESGGKNGTSTFVPEYFRKTFALEKAVSRARLHVTAKGLYEVYLNGQKAGEDFMVPGWAPYHARIETLTYDVTDALKKGDNAIGAVLGEGWYAGNMMRKSFVYPAARPMLLAQLEITCADGSTQRIVTDASWKATDKGPIRYSNIYGGEVYDAALEMPGWSRPGFDDVHWSGVFTEAVLPEPALVPKRHSAVRAMTERPTLKITEPKAGRFVFDLGQNMVGWPRVAIPVKKGRKVTIRFAEMLNKDGTLYTANYRRAHSTAYYVPAKDGYVTWHPTFTFFGFRYVELSGLPEGSKPEPGWVTGIVLHSAFSPAGSFISSHELLNRLQKNITWGQRGNFLDIPTDCPQRDERLGWTGDAQVFGPTSLFNYDVHAFWMSWLQSVREEQTPAGLIPHVVPDTGCGQGSPGWGDVACVSPWDVYVRTGDRGVLEENYDMMKKWVGAYERQARGFIVNRKGYGDWLAPGPKTPHTIISTAYFGRDTGIMRKAALVLGKRQDAEKYEKQFADIRAAFSANFFDDTGTLKLKAQPQTAYLMALGFHLLEPELRKGATENLVKLVMEGAGGHLRTGFLGTPLIAPVLDREGHTDAAYTVLFKESYPSWFFSIHQGATTLWERWNSYSHKGGFGNAGMNSFNHYAYGAIGQWMYERIAGLAPDPAQPGYKHFFVQPVPGGPLTHAEATLETRYGTAAAGWQKTDAGLVVNATVPPNTTATFVVPSISGGLPVVTEAGTPCKLTQRDKRTVYEVGPGRYEFVVKTP